jgi:hypothetical protein
MVLNEKKFYEISARLECCPQKSLMIPCTGDWNLNALA